MVVNNFDNGFSYIIRGQQFDVKVFGKGVFFLCGQIEIEYYFVQMMLFVCWCGGLDYQCVDYYRNVFGYCCLIFMYLILEGSGVVFFQEYKGVVGGKGWYCGGILIVDMKSGYYCYVYVIIVQGDLLCRVIVCKVQVIVGNYYFFWM